MEQPTVARSYATALFELSERQGEHEAFTRAFAAVIALLDADPQIRDFLRTPRITVAEKKRALQAAFDGQVPPLFLNFLMVVLDNRRQHMLRAISREYDRMLDEHLSRVNVAVTLARDPDAAALTDITTRLTKLLQKKVIAHVRVDPEILGGIIVRYGDNVMDGSLRRQLLHLRGRMLTAALPALTTRQ
jgi:F-type H+-transporting ATPase subunit delta